MTTVTRTHELVREGRFAVEVEVALIDTGTDWSPCYSLADAEKRTPPVTRFAAATSQQLRSSARSTSCRRLQVDAATPRDGVP